MMHFSVKMSLNPSVKDLSFEIITPALEKTTETMLGIRRTLILGLICMQDLYILIVKQGKNVMKTTLKNF